MQTQMGIWKRFIRNLLGVDRCSLSSGSGRGLLEVYLGWTDAASAWDLQEVYYQGWTNADSAGDLEDVYYKFISGGQMQPQLGIWKRYIRSLSEVDRCSLSWGFGRGLLQVYYWGTELAEAGDLEEVYSKFIGWVQNQLRLRI